MAADPRIQRFVASVFSAGRATTLSPTLTVERIHDDHADFVWRSLQRLGVRDSDLEDALQEVFIVVHRRLGTFDGSSRITTWLYGICLRVASSSRNRAHVRRERPSSELDDRADFATDDDPEAALAARESEQRLRRALDALTPEKRSVLVMFEVEGIAAGEIAQIVGVPVGTVYSRLSAARAEFAAVVKRMDLREKIRGVR